MGDNIEESLWRALKSKESSVLIQWLVDGHCEYLSSRMVNREQYFKKSQSELSQQLSCFTKFKSHFNFISLFGKAGAQNLEMKQFLFKCINAK